MTISSTSGVVRPRRVVTETGGNVIDIITLSIRETAKVRLRRTVMQNPKKADKSLFCTLWHLIFPMVQSWRGITTPSNAKLYSPFNERYYHFTSPESSSIWIAAEPQEAHEIVTCFRRRLCWTWRAWQECKSLHAVVQNFDITNH